VKQSVSTLFSDAMLASTCCGLVLVVVLLWSGLRPDHLAGPKVSPPHGTRSLLFTVVVVWSSPHRSLLSSGLHHIAPCCGLVSDQTTSLDQRSHHRAGSGLYSLHMASSTCNPNEYESTSCPSWRELETTSKNENGPAWNR